MKRLLIIVFFVFLAVPARNKRARYYGPADQLWPADRYIREAIDTVWYKGELIQVTRVTEVSYILTKIR